MVGDLLIYNLEGKEFMVDLESVLPYEISAVQAKAQAGEDLGEALGRFFKVAAAPPEEDDKQEKANEQENKSEKINRTAQFLQDLKDTVSIIWNTTTTENEEDLAKNQQRIKEVRERMEKRGLEVGDEFEKIPSVMREKYRHKEGGESIKDNVEKLKKAFGSLKDTLNEIGAESKPKE
ncbi:MAG: hypothetical protein DHS20C18_34850 [Saprospiraceae bacterium]|nr:MAG: hypothetical protein DHS20C18_34850 [Saprospiraceae bacterium]